MQMLLFNLSKIYLIRNCEHSILHPLYEFEVYFNGNTRLKGTTVQRRTLHMRRSIAVRRVIGGTCA